MAPDNDPYASIATPVQDDDPYASIATPIAKQHAAPVQSPESPSDASLYWRALTNPVGEGVKSATSPLGAAEQVGGQAINAISKIPHAVMHPLDTMKALGDEFYPDDPNQTPGIVKQVGDAATGLVHGQPLAAENLAGQTLGSIEGGRVLGAGTEAATKAATGAGSAVSRFASGARDAAIGDPDAAALKGLRVASGSPKALATIKDVNAAKPYLKGAESLEDLQSRIPDAKNEIWDPYKQAIDKYGFKKVNGPDGPTTLGALEQERLEVSAQLRALKSRDPQAVQTAIQKGQGEADLLAREKAIKAAMDPHLENAGINPTEIRSRFAAVSKVGQKIAGRTTLGDPSQPYGVGKLADLSVSDITHPLNAVKKVGSAATDLVAGRPPISGKPVDVAIKSAFRNAPAKPNLYHEDHIQDGKTAADAQVPSEVKALLHRTGAQVTNKEAPTSKSVASVDPDQPNTINIDDMERFNKDSDARNQTISHEAVHNWHQNLPPAIQKMIPLDNPKDLYGKDDKGYEQDDLKNMRGQGVKLWNLPKEKAAAVIQTYAHLGGDKAPKAVQDVYKPWAQDMVTSPLNPHGASADQPAEMHETKILAEDKPKKEKVTESVPHGTKHPAGDITGFDEETGLPIVKRSLGGSKEPANNPVTAKPEKEDTPDGKRDVLHASKDRDELVAEGKSHAPHLESGLKAAADSVPGAKLEGVRSEKDPERLDEKIKREGQPVETVPDVLAGRISVDNDEAHKGVVDDIKKHATVVREKDEFKKGDSRFGFHSHKLQVKVSPKMSAEVQVVPKEVAANDKKQHPVYKQAREAELDGDTGKADLLAEKSKGMNEEAKSRFDKRNKEKEENNLDAKPVVENKNDSALHKVGDRVTLPGGKSATVAYAPSKGAQLPTYRFKGDDGSTTTMRASEAHSKVKKAPDDVPDGKEVAVDLDKTLSFTHGQTARTHIGAPQPEMVARIKKDLAAGKKVAIFTARVSNDPDGKVREAIQAWSKKHIGVALPVTDKKTEDVGEILDDKAKHVVPNKGKVMA